MYQGTTSKMWRRRWCEAAENKEEDIQYNLPVEVLDCKVVSLGRDGTTVHIIKEGYRETMNGTISFL